MEPLFCALCGQPQVPGDTFCPGCGSLQRPSPPSTIGTALSAQVRPPGPGATPTSGPAAHPVLVAVVVVVTLLLVGTALGILVVQLETSGPGPPPSFPIGSAFAAGDPIEGVCPTGNTFVTGGCAPDHAAYTLEVRASTVTFGDVVFEVLTTTGSVARETDGLGFTILNATDVVLVQFAVADGQMSMGSGAWTYASDATSSSPLTTWDTIMIDIGTTDPTGQGPFFVAVGVAQYTGTTSIALP